jgi:hypothetical protein
MGASVSIGTMIVGKKGAEAGVGEITGMEDAEDEQHKQRQEQQRQVDEANKLFMERSASQNKALTDALKGGGGAQQRKRIQTGQGRGDTIKTGPKGLGEIEPSNTGRKELLGY